MTGAMDVAVRDNRDATRFEAAVDGQVAVVEYNLIKDGIVVAHTEVPSPLEGRGIAGRLFAAVIATARHEARRVIPVCPVFALWLRRHPETHDVIDPSYRHALGLPPVAAPGG